MKLITCFFITFDTLKKKKALPASTPCSVVLHSTLLQKFPAAELIASANGCKMAAMPNLNGLPLMLLASFTPPQPPLQELLGPGGSRGCLDWPRC